MKYHFSIRSNSVFYCAESHHHSLCASCDSPLGCFTSDKYHGREGALLCITDNAGDIAWVRLDDTRQHFEVGIQRKHY